MNNRKPSERTPGPSHRQNPGDRATSIRAYHPRDYGALLALWSAAGLPVKRAGRDNRYALERQIAEAGAFLAVAEAGGVVVGAVLATHDGRKGWINRLAVAPSYRRRGVASRLVAAAEERLAEAGIEIFACLVEGDNETSMRTFERLGYKRFPAMAYFTKRLREGI